MSFVLFPGEIGIFEDGEDINIISLPPTPSKPLQIEEPLPCGISTQILPLSRLSLSSNHSSSSPHSSSSTSPQSLSSSISSNIIARTLAGKEKKNAKENKRHSSAMKTTPTLKERDKQNKDMKLKDEARKETKSLTSLEDTNTIFMALNNTLASNTSIANAITTTTAAGMTTESSELSTTTPTGKKVSPVRDKLDRLKKSLTEPLLHYFQVSPECEEEPDLLNTPRSLASVSQFTALNLLSIEEPLSVDVSSKDPNDQQPSASTSSSSKVLFSEDNVDSLEGEEDEKEGKPNCQAIVSAEDANPNKNDTDETEEELPTPPPTPPPPTVTDM